MQKVSNKVGVISPFHSNLTGRSARQDELGDHCARATMPAAQAATLYFGSASGCSVGVWQHSQNLSLKVEPHFALAMTFSASEYLVLRSASSDPQDLRVRALRRVHVLEERTMDTDANAAEWNC